MLVLERDGRSDCTNSLHGKELLLVFEFKCLGVNFSMEETGITEVESTVMQGELRMHCTPQ